MSKKPETRVKMRGGGSILSKPSILGHLNDNVIIDPFNKDQLGNCSYDVTLGNWIFRECKTPDRFFDVYNTNDYSKVWGKEEYHEKHIDLEPGEIILAHTNEYIGGLEDITTKMQARSSMGRSFVEVCKCAGWGDIGYINRWTMEITNNSRYHTIRLTVGKPIAQIVFMRCSKKIESQDSYCSPYQPDADLEDLKRNWSPLCMLPKPQNGQCTS